MMTDVDGQQIRRKPVLGGLINEYTHAALRTGDLKVASRIVFSSGTGSASPAPRAAADRAAQPYAEHAW
jgi:hypothetical protein